MKIAYFSPLNPIRSGISDYSEELLEYLQSYAKIDLFVDDYEPSNSWLRESFAIKSFREMLENHHQNSYDIHIYHMGNNENHAYIYRSLLEYPGIVVLHEPIIHHFIFSQTAAKGRLEDYIQELTYCYGERGVEIATRALSLEEESVWYDYHLCDRMIDSSLGIIVHSEFARKKVLEVRPNAKVKVIRHHYAPHKKDHLRPPDVLREVLGFSKSDFVVGCFGYMTSSKHIDKVLQVIAKVRDKGYRVKLLLVGEMMPGCDASRWIEELGIDDNVLVTGFVDGHTFREYLQLPDIFIALRHPSAGETSGSVIKMMGTGKPVMISDFCAFGEFPDDCCVKIPPDDTEEEILEEKLAHCIESPEERHEIGERAREYILRHQDIQVSARLYMDFVAEVLSNAPFEVSKKSGLLDVGDMETASK